MKLRALVLDDEYSDRTLLKKIIQQYCVNIEVKYQADRVITATEMIKEFEPDIIFLDIGLPGESGFDLLKLIDKDKFLIVFVTGHDNFGIEAVKNGAFDYLLKPISVDEVIQMEVKINSFFHNKGNAVYLKVFHNREHRLIHANQIICLMAQGSYTKIYLNDGQSLLISKNITQTMKELPVLFLHKVHRSYVINSNYVTLFKTVENEMFVELTNKITVKVSRQFRAVFKNLFS